VPWKVSHLVSERMLFIGRLEAGERMTDLCREYGISRKTGYKFMERYRELGAIGLYDQRRIPERVPHRTPDAVKELFLEARGLHPTWGSKKLKAWLESRMPGLKLPAASTVHGLLRRAGLVKPRRRSQSTRAEGTALSAAGAPNDLWCADFKGQFRMQNGRYCYPLTITDQRSRFILGCEAFEQIDGTMVRTAFESTFRTFGMPRAIRTDNGPPFASRGLQNLSRLSVWWKRLGIAHERIQPSHPEQNGQHERMHRTLKAETARPAAANLLQQQERFDRFVEVFNQERPHEALQMQPPTRIYEKSATPFPKQLPAMDYPLHDLVRQVKPSGHLYLHRAVNVYLGAALAGEQVGLREVDEARWLVSFADWDLGYLNERTNRFELESPDQKEVSPMCPV
jgi:transposase InsO family protein